MYSYPQNQERRKKKCWGEGLLNKEKNTWEFFFFAFIEKL